MSNAASSSNSMASKQRRTKEIPAAVRGLTTSRRRGPFLQMAQSDFSSEYISGGLEGRAGNGLARTKGKKMAGAVLFQDSSCRC